VAVTITVVEGADRQLVPAIRDAGLTVAATLPIADLPNLERAARPPDLLILDLRGQAGVPTVLGVLKRKFAQMAVLIVASQLDPTMMLEAMRAGVSDFVTEPLGPDQVKEAIERIIGAQAPAAPGKVLAFLGAKGGVGATTLAVNVAVAVAADRPNSVLMADLHAAVHGDVGILLGVEPRFSVIDALQNLNRLDGAYLRSLVLRAKSGVDALTSPETPALRPPDAQQIRTLIDRLAANYRYVVLDVPRSDFGVLDALEPATAIMLVVNQELPTVRRAAQLGNLLRQRYGKERVATVVSRYDPRADIGQEDIERVIGLPVWGVLPSDYRKVLLAANAGRPLVSDNHSRLAASVVQLARQLTGPGSEKTEKTKTKSKGGFFSL
jgi:pilus assembly protein CpaE